MPADLPPCRLAFAAMRLPVVLLASLLVLAACTAGEASPIVPTVAPPASPAPPTQGATDTPTLPPTATQPPATDAPVATPPIETDVPQEIMLELLAEVALQAGVDPAQVRIERAEEVTWSDPSLGCPDPDLGYAQVITPGYWVVLEAGGQLYDWRMATTGIPILCPEGQGEPPLEEDF
jgi:hypothetical protein